MIHSHLHWTNNYTNLFDIMHIKCQDSEDKWFTAMILFDQLSYSNNNYINLYIDYDLVWLYWIIYTIYINHIYRLWFRFLCKSENKEDLFIVFLMLSFYPDASSHHQHQAYTIGWPLTFLVYSLKSQTKVAELITAHSTLIMSSKTLWHWVHLHLSHVSSIRYIPPQEFAAFSDSCMELAYTNNIGSHKNQ